MHNNFLIDRRGKMSKSAGEFLRLQTLVDKGFHPLAYRLMCLQAHYRSELEFSWEGLLAAFVRLKRIVSRVEPINWPPSEMRPSHPKLQPSLNKFDQAIADDLNTPVALTALEDLLAIKKVDDPSFAEAISYMDAVLGLRLFPTANEDGLYRAAMRIRPVTTQITEVEIEAALTARKEARAAKDFAKSDAIRNDLIARGVEVMDGDPLGWDWRLEV
jgi:cysteinyl-tRNA synthetase